jgi:hypothetical protein
MTACTGRDFKAFRGCAQQATGNVIVLHLPDAGLYGNSHFMFSDLNNVPVADQLSLFLSTKGLELR